ncbi:MAG: hypothetical protein C5B51_03370 [Terriglobia bacterium]|nr:MAG: hypothetical protein C5B51_03370 [Terriglobia bacterium]
MERRQVTRSFAAFTLELEKHQIPADAILEDFRVGRGHEGLQPENRNVASFHYDGKVYFNILVEVVGNTKSLTQSVS